MTVVICDRKRETGEKGSGAGACGLDGRHTVQCVDAHEAEHARLCDVMRGREQHLKPSIVGSFMVFDIPKPTAQCRLI